MKVTYDTKLNAAYITFTDIKSGDIKMTYCCARKEVRGEIAMYFNSKMHLISMEVLDANTKLPRELLERAEII